MNIISGDYEKAMKHCEDLYGGKYYMFEFPYTPISSKFREIDRFIDESLELAPHQNLYRGNVVVDISEWIHNHELNSYFFAFLYFLKDREFAYDVTLISEAPIGTKIADELVKKGFTRKVHTYHSKGSENRTARIGFVPEHES